MEQTFILTLNDSGWDLVFSMSEPIPTRIYGFNVDLFTGNRTGRLLVPLNVFEVVDVETSLPPVLIFFYKVSKID